MAEFVVGVFLHMVVPFRSPSTQMLAELFRSIFQIEDGKFPQRWRRFELLPFSSCCCCQVVAVFVTTVNIYQMEDVSMVPPRSDEVENFVCPSLIWPEIFEVESSIDQRSRGIVQ